MDDSWKGMHLIKGIKPINMQGRDSLAKLEQRARNLSRIKGARRYGTCIVPGCDAPLCKSNTSRVCVNHNHKEPHCECSKCKK